MFYGPQAEKVWETWGHERLASGPQEGNIFSFNCDFEVTLGYIWCELGVLFVRKLGLSLE